MGQINKNPLFLNTNKLVIVYSNGGQQMKLSYKYLILDKFSLDYYTFPFCKGSEGSEDIKFRCKFLLK